MKFLRAIVFAAITSLLYLGLPLIGWGLDDIGRFFSLPARIAYALSAALFAGLVGIQAVGGTEGIRGGKGDRSKLIARETAVRFGLVSLLYAALLLIPFADRRNILVTAESAFLRGSGAALSALGYGFIYWSGLALGKQYSPEVTIQKDHQLITAGPFRKIRHPRYLGVILLLIGFSLVFRSGVGLAAAPLIIGILLLRIHDEETLLGREFGKDWENYCRKSWRLLPGIW